MQDVKAANALKAKLRRLCEMKKSGKINVPTWLHDLWKRGDHMQMALEFEKTGFCKDTITRNPVF